MTFIHENLKEMLWKKYIKSELKFENRIVINLKYIILNKIFIIILRINTF